MRLGAELKLTYRSAFLCLLLVVAMPVEYSHVSVSNWFHHSGNAALLLCVVVQKRTPSLSEISLFFSLLNGERFMISPLRCCFFSFSAPTTTLFFFHFQFQQHSSI
ncbi:hypothetical protein RIF29_15836 [Crotalaria pallida]|uniref:Secreted protein n=1 Tax=Crotalaria pallida TaxID=3830 RepID=A0AAN9FLB4_CROPI